MNIEKVILDWNEYIEAARSVVSEGCVLLENNGTLPLEKGAVVSIFGRIQTHYYKSGTGSGGMVNVTHVVGVPEGLKLSGHVTVNEELENIYKEWEEENPFDEGLGWGTEPWSQPEMELTDEIVSNASVKSDVAIVIIGRTAGEDKDFSDVAGAYKLSETEEDMLRRVRKHFDKMIVLLNVGSLMDLNVISEINPDALMVIWQGGMIGGLGTADVLTGKVNPSGKLTDTIAYEINDYPSTENFGDPVRDYYAEDIYVGYRYFETFEKSKVRYPFGYGISYTEFEHTVGEFIVDVNNRTFTASCTVKNTGSVAGKDVAQFYVSAPQGKLGKSEKVLVAFKKTGILNPGKEEKITVTVPFDRFASFDDTGVTGAECCFVLESGEYTVYEGKNVRESYKEGSFTLEENIVTEKLSKALAPMESFKRMKASENSDGTLSVIYEDVPVSDVDEKKRRLDNMPVEIPQDFTARYSLKDVLSGSVDMEKFIARLSDDDLACIVRGEGMGSSLVTAGTAAAFGGVSEYLRKMDIPAVCCDDGPSGMRLDSGATAFSMPNGTMLASTFNPDVIERMYGFTSLEMIYNKVECLLGPGMNIHRNPLNGRNFEYFSEDPYLNGTIASAMLKGLHKYGSDGVAKHFCCNNQELGRQACDSVVSQRALREIYLKGFEIAVKEGGCKAFMTTYAQVNGMWTAGNYDLNTRILRDEWGFKGIVMTDWWAQVNDRGGEPTKNNTAAMVRAQNDLYMVTANAAMNSANDNTLSQLSEGKLNRAELQRCAMNICEYAMNTMAMKRLCHNDIKVEIAGRVIEEDAFDIENAEYLVLKGNITVSLKDKESKAGTNYYIPLDIQDLGMYDISVTASSMLGEVAQLPCTLYYTGVPFLTYTFNGSGGKDVTITKSMDFHNRMAVIRLNVAKNGLNLDRIEFKKQQ